MKELFQFWKSIYGSPTVAEHAISTTLEQWLQANTPSNRIGVIVSELQSSSAKAIRALTAAGTELEFACKEELSQYELGERISYYCWTIDQYLQWRKACQPQDLGTTSLPSPSASSVMLSSQSASSSGSSSSQIPPSPAPLQISSIGSTNSSPEAQPILQPSASTKPSSSDVCIPPLPPEKHASLTSHNIEHVHRMLWTLKKAQARTQRVKQPLEWLSSFDPNTLSNALIEDVICVVCSLLDLDYATIELPSHTMPLGDERRNKLLDLNYALGLLSLPVPVPLKPLPSIAGPAETEIDFEITWVRALTILDMALREVALIQDKHAALALRIPVKDWPIVSFKDQSVSLGDVKRTVMHGLQAMRSTIKQHYGSSQ